MRRVAVFDCETQPFDGISQNYRPFAIGFFDGIQYRRFWGYHCVSNFIYFLKQYPEPLVLYAHNGGKFDFIFFMPWMDQNLLLINGRITKAIIPGSSPGIKHELRDSYSIIPEPLSDFTGQSEKIKIDYEWMKPQFREKHKAEICEYLRMDCMTLYEGVMHFRNDFADALTIGMASLKEFRKFHPFEKLTETEDAIFRKFYFGGRCQCFKVGLFKLRGETFKIYDVNSMYASVMKKELHPVTASYDMESTITRRTTFACIEATNDGVLPQRVKTNGVQSLDFTVRQGIFFASIHEINAGLDLGLLKIKRVVYSIAHHKRSSFATFVDWTNEKKLEMEKKGERAKRNNYKRVQNSCYGKFAQDPGNFKDHIILPVGQIPPEPWIPSFINDEYAIYQKPSIRHVYNNVAISASITSAARAVLLRGLASSSSPLYCDTDSIICKRFNGDIDPFRLGAWKLEKEGSTLAIAGKKQYVLKAGNEVLKLAAKGVPVKHPRLSDTICQLAERRDTFAEIPNVAPHFNLDGSVTYITRRIHATGKATAFAQTPSLERVARKPAR